MPRYAAQTNVSVEKSRAEVEETVRRYGADGYRHGWGDRDGKRIEQIEFSASNRHVRFTLVMPSPEEFADSDSEK